MEHKSAYFAEKIQNETFDLDPEDISKFGYRSIDLIVEYFKNIRHQSIFPDKTLDQMKNLINEPLPQNEQNPQLVLDDFQDKILPYVVRVGHPHLLGWVLASGTPIGALADGISGALNQNVAVSGSSTSTAVELLVLDWIKEILGYDRKSAGILVSGGTMANLTALTVARNVKANFDVRTQGMKSEKRMMIYASQEVHSCILKAIQILGIGTNNIQWVTVDEHFRLNPMDLKSKIDEDLNNGNQPFAVVATAGTVNTGAIDPLESISDICQNYNLWFHVDAAYGGFATLSPQLKPLLNGITRADSVALDPHKWLFIPFDVGCVLVKNPEHMTQTFAIKTKYIHINNEKIPTSDDVDFADYGIQLSRNFRALKIWMSLKQYGVKKYGRLIDQNVNLAYYFTALIEESSDFETLAPTNLSVVCFRYTPKDLQQSSQDIEHYLNHLNRAIAEAMCTDSRALLSSTVLQEKFVLRACIVNFRTTKQDIQDIIQILRELGEKEDKKLCNSKL